MWDGVPPEGDGLNRWSWGILGRFFGVAFPEASTELVHDLFDGVQHGDMTLAVVELEAFHSDFELVNT